MPTPEWTRGYEAGERAGYERGRREVAEAAWAVKVLDAHMGSGGHIDLACIDGKWDLELYGKGGTFTHAYTEPSADAARIAAAKALVAEDPSLDPDAFQTCSKHTGRRSLE